MNTFSSKKDYMKENYLRKIRNESDIKGIESHFLNRDTVRHHEGYGGESAGLKRIVSRGVIVFNRATFGIVRHNALKNMC